MAACGDDFTVAVTEDGELFAWGDGGNGHLGLDAVLHQQQPARAGGPELFGNQRIRLAAAGQVPGHRLAHHGFEFVDEPMTFRDLVHELKDSGHIMPSCYPSRGGTFEWVSSEPQMDMEGVWRHTSVHYAQKNPNRNQKYWRWAFIHAGLIKGAQA